MTQLPIVCLAVMVSTLVGGLVAIRCRDKLHLVLGFAAGAVVSVALLDILPEAAEILGGIETAAPLVAAGFVAYMLFDRTFSLHARGEGDGDAHHHGRMGATTLVVHSIMDGIGVGVAFRASPTIGIVVAAAVLAHDFSDGLNTVGFVRRDVDEDGVAWRWLIADAVAPVIGICLGFCSVMPTEMLGPLLALFAGGFVYMGASDLIPESYHRHPTLLTSIMTVLGFASIWGITSVVH